MSQNSEQALTFLSLVVSGSQGGAEQPLMSADHALDLPALPIDAFEEPPFHLPPILGFGPAASRVTSVQGDDRTANPQPLAAQAVVALAVIAGVAQQTGQVDVANGLPHRGPKLRMVVARSANHEGSGNQMALRVTDQGELGPAATAKTPVSTAFYKVGAHVVAFQAGGVNRSLGLGSDQVKLASAVENGAQEAGKSPFFRRRSSA